MTSNSTLLNYTVRSILENVEIWDEKLQKETATALYNTIAKIVRNFDTNNFIDIIDDILQHFVTMMTIDDKNVCEEYIRNFEEITLVMTNNKFKVSAMLIEKATSLGAFGKNATSRRYSVFVCTCLIRVILSY